MLLPFFGRSQMNLIPNGSFEEYTWCPVGIADFSVKDWYSPTGATPDYYNICSTGDVGIPANFAGIQFPKNGNAYSGFLAGGFTSLQYNAREYIQVKLSEELSSNEIYNFSCYLSLAEISRFACRKVSFAFSEYDLNEIFTTNITSMTNIQYLEIDNLGDTIEWTACSGLYLAKGGEQYLTIGVFEDDLNADFHLYNESMEAFSYYYIDDVKLEKYDFTNIPNVFTPNNDGVNDFWSFNFINNFEIRILNRWGQIVFEQYIQDNVCQWDGETNNATPCEEGVYFYSITKNNLKKTGFIHLVR